MDSERGERERERDWGFGEKEGFGGKIFERPRQDCFLSIEDWFSSTEGFIVKKPIEIELFKRDWQLISSEWDKDCKNQAFKPIYPSRSVFPERKERLSEEMCLSNGGVLRGLCEGSPGLCGVLLGSTTGFFPGVVTLCW